MGDDPMLELLRQQFRMASVESIEVSGAGFFARFHWKQEPETLAHIHHAGIGSIQIESPDLEHGGGLVLFIRDGRLSMLEGYSHVCPWDQPLSGYVLSTPPGHIEFVLNHLKKATGSL